MNRDNKLLKVTTLVLLITIIAVALVSGTYAKYTSTASGTDTAKVAKWSFTVEGTEIATEQAPTVTFDLFETKDTNNVNGDLLAPGTSGSFELNVANLSEVNATYSIAFTGKNTNNIPLQFSINNQTWEDSIEALNITNKPIAMLTGTDAVTVYWKWVYEVEGTGANEEEKAASIVAANKADTALGILAQDANAVPEYTVTASITATQVD